MFQTRLGSGLYYLLQSGAKKATSRIGESLEGQGQMVQTVVAVAAATAVVWATLWAVRKWRREKFEECRYTRLSGDARREIMRSYLRAERLLKRRGISRRARSQTIGEYLESAAVGLGGMAQELSWFARAAWAAAYDPTEPSAELAQEAAERLSHLKRMATRPG